MPGINIGAYEIRFYEYDLDERPHVHVRREGKQAKFWLMPVQMYRNSGFADFELGRIERILRDNRERLIRLWDEEMKKR
mgnify:FL=1